MVDSPTGFEQTAEWSRQESSRLRARANELEALANDLAPTGGPLPEPTPEKIAEAEARLELTESIECLQRGLEEADSGRPFLEYVKGALSGLEAGLNGFDRQSAKITRLGRELEEARAERDKADRRRFAAEALNKGLANRIEELSAREATARGEERLALIAILKGRSRGSYDGYTSLSEQRLIDVLITDIEARSKS